MRAGVVYKPLYTSLIRPNSHESDVRHIHWKTVILLGIFTWLSNHGRWFIIGIFWGCTGRWPRVERTKLHCFIRITFLFLATLKLTRISPSFLWLAYHVSTQWATLSCWSYNRKGGWLRTHRCHMEKISWLRFQFISILRHKPRNYSQAKVPWLRLKTPEHLII